MHDDDGFIHTNGTFFTSTQTHSTSNPRPISIALPPTSTVILLTTEQANTLLTQLAETLFDSDLMDTATADHVHYLTRVVRSDGAETLEAITMGWET